MPEGRTQTCVLFGTVGIKLRVGNGLLMKVLVSTHGFAREMFVIPDALVHTILKNVHNDPLGDIWLSDVL